MKRYLLFSLLLSGAVILSVALSFAVFSIIYHALEPQTLSYPLGNEGLRQFVLFQELLGRMQAVDPLKQNYDVTFVTENGSIAYYRLLSVDERFYSGLSRLFSQGDFGRLSTEYGKPVIELLSVTLRYDLIYLLVAAATGPLGLLIGLLKNHPKIQMTIVVAIMAICLTYALLGIFLIHEPYSYLISGVLFFAVPLSAALNRRFGFQWWQIPMVFLLSFAAAVVLLIPFSYKANYLHLWMYSHQYFAVKESWAAAYGYGIETLLFLLPLGIGSSFFALARKSGSSTK
ncbi:MAG: hypothetical protein IJU64_05495 [Bacilli bacterium]|nr:hypothetical protein [Bacilli bacterium]